MTVASRWAFVLAVGSTSTAVCLSTLSGWQRGGTMSERLVWVAIGIVLVVSAHLLPALIRESSIVARVVGSLLWVACMATACYGHATFFLLAQSHAGEQRAASVVVVASPSPARGLTVVMADRANVTRQLALTQIQRCLRDCAVLEARRVTLASKLDALDAEADDIRRLETVGDRVTAQRDALLADPVTPRLAALLGVTTARVDLLSGLAFSVALEGVACLLWAIALRPSPVPASVSPVTPPAVTSLSEPVTTATRVTQPAATTVTAAVMASHGPETVVREPETGSHEAPDDPVTPLLAADATDDDVMQLARDLAAGRLRPTVADIRRHLGCSQARAAALRRQLAERNVTA